MKILILICITLLAIIFVLVDFQKKLKEKDLKISQLSSEINLWKETVFTRIQHLPNTPLNTEWQSLGASFDSFEPPSYTKEVFFHRGDTYTVYSSFGRDKKTYFRIQPLTWNIALNEKVVLDFSEAIQDLSKGGNIYHGVKLVPLSMLNQYIYRPVGTYKPYITSKDAVQILLGRDDIKMRKFYKIRQGTHMDLFIDFVANDKYFVFSQSISTTGYYHSPPKDGYEVEDWIEEKKKDEVKELIDFANSLSVK